MKTVTEVANELLVSDVLIYKKINKTLREQLAPFVTKEIRNGKKVTTLSDEGIEIIKCSLDTLTIDNDNDSKPMANDNPDLLTTLVNNLRSQLSEKDRQIDKLFEQLSAKDNQIAEKDKQLANADNRLMESHSITMKNLNLTERQQALLQAAIDEAEQPGPEPVQPVKVETRKFKWFWQK